MFIDILELEKMQKDEYEYAFYNMDNSMPGKSVNVVPIVGAALAGMTNPRPAGFAIRQRKV